MKTLNRNHKDSSSATTPTPKPDVRPYWIPDGVKFEDLPATLRLGIREILTPAYCELVLGAANALERLNGLSLVHLLWLELLEQHELFDHVRHHITRGQMGDTAHERTDRHLRLVMAKDKLIKSAVQLRKLEERDIDPTLGDMEIQRP